MSVSKRWWMGVVCAVGLCAGSWVWAQEGGGEGWDRQEVARLRARLRYVEDRLEALERLVESQQETIDHLLEAGHEGGERHDDAELHRELGELKEEIEGLIEEHGEDAVVVGLTKLELVWRSMEAKLGEEHPRVEVLEEACDELWGLFEEGEEEDYVRERLEVLLAEYWPRGRGDNLKMLYGELLGVLGEDDPRVQEVRRMLGEYKERHELLGPEHPQTEALRDEVVERMEEILEGEEREHAGGLEEALEQRERELGVRERELELRQRELEMRAREMELEMRARGEHAREEARRMEEVQRAYLEAQRSAEREAREAQRQAEREAREEAERRERARRDD